MKIKLGKICRVRKIDSIESVRIGFLSRINKNTRVEMNYKYAKSAAYPSRIRTVVVFELGARLGGRALGADAMASGVSSAAGPGFHPPIAVLTVFF
jgi:hypothetical protein